LERERREKKKGRSDQRRYSSEEEREGYKLHPFPQKSNATRPKERRKEERKQFALWRYLAERGEEGEVDRLYRIKEAELVYTRLEKKKKKKNERTLRNLKRGRFER